MSDRSPPSPLTPEQCRQARELLERSPEDLAERTGMTADAIRRFEDKGGGRPPSKGALVTLARALETAGVELIPGGACLRQALEAEEVILPGAPDERS